MLLRVLVLSIISLSLAGPCLGQGSLVRKPAQELFEALGKYVTRTGTREFTEELAEAGGEVALRELAERTIREGGDEALELLTVAVRSHGSDAVRAARNSANVPRLLDALESLPADDVGRALRRLSSETGGKALAETVEQFGVQALQAELRHPGVGGSLVRYLGDDGADLAMRVSTDDAIQVARHADEIAALPLRERRGVLQLLHEDTERMVAWMGRFAEQNPKATLFTALATPVVLKNADDILGGHGDLVVGPDGTPRYVEKRGLIERLLGPLLTRILSVLLPIIAVAVAIWLAIRIRYSYKTRKLRFQVAAAKAAPAVASRSAATLPLEASISENEDQQPGLTRGSHDDR